jgi:hypothetical protein
VSETISSHLQSDYQDSLQEPWAKENGLDFARSEALRELHKLLSPKLVARQILRGAVACPEVIGVIPPLEEASISSEIRNLVGISSSDIEPLAMRINEIIGSGRIVVLKPLNNATGIGVCFLRQSEEGLQATVTSYGVHVHTGEKLFDPWHVVLEKHQLQSEKIISEGITTYTVPTNVLPELITSYLGNDRAATGIIAEAYIEGRITDERGYPIEQRFDIVTQINGNELLQPKSIVKVGGNQYFGTVSGIDNASAVRKDVLAYLQELMPNYPQKEVAKTLVSITRRYIELLSSISFVDPTDVLRLTIDLCFVPVEGNLVPVLIEVHCYIKSFDVERAVNLP